MTSPGDRSDLAALTDEQLVRLAEGEAEDAFGVLVSRCASMIQQQALRLRRVSIDAEDLADRSVFNYSQCDLLVLPYGERFPFDALVNYKEYVHDGGKVLTLGGHAVLNLLQDDPGHAAGVSIPSAGGDGT